MREMGAKLSFQMLKLCVILSYFQIHGSSAPGMYGSRRSTLALVASPVHHESSSHHSSKSWTKPEPISPETSFFEHHHRHHHNHHDHDGHQHPSIPYNYDKPAAGPSNTHSPSLHAHHVPIHPPYISPSSYSMELTPPPVSAQFLPPPPPNEDCSTVTCPEGWTSTLSGSPCGCVLPIQVRLQLNIGLYTFFPLVSELASEIASSLSLEQSQVRIMGANAADQQPEKTNALTYLVPISKKFKFDTPFFVYQKFWRKQVHVNYSLFGAYNVIDVHYPGLPPSPPSLSANLAAIDNHHYPGNHKENDGNSLKPLGVDVPRARRQKNGFSRRVAIVIIISCVTVFVTFAAMVWILLASCRSSSHQHKPALHPKASSFTKPSGADWLALGSRSFSESMSFNSGMLNVTGYAKIYSLQDIEKATDAFSSARVLGEGGFGVVYKATFDDGEEVAVKVLKRDNRHGAREFLSEVEMLSRLHHKNLVKLLGICTEEHIRCLVYELVPNGSVDSHLHGKDTEGAPLDWRTRIKIALGAARGLAYLHEDSSPCVIHRDFKSSNILLEQDFMPKVSDFGLATNALNGGNQPISTHVIGTFGYLAPEYAMTGHLLIKSDVYSYGVVLLELLTGRKPVDFSNPPGQENLVTWTQPLLTSNEGLDLLMDPTLNPIPSFDNFSKVAAIASMCVQPEVSRRPFMGEVVQALKLVCSELDHPNEEKPRSSSSNLEKVSLGEIQEFLGGQYPALDYQSSSDANKVTLSAVDLVSVSAGFEGMENETWRRQCSSGPLREKPFWQRLGRYYTGSMHERLWPGRN